MIDSAVAGWIGLALMPAAALLGWILRAVGRGSFVSRLRPHFVLGYGALAMALYHVVTSLPGMGGSNATGIWFASFALAGLAIQAFVGASLQAPGTFRIPLRRWHLVLFIAAFVFAIAHVFYNASFIPQSAMDGAIKPPMRDQRPVLRSLAIREPIWEFSAVGLPRAKTVSLNEVSATRE